MNATVAAEPGSEEPLISSRTFWLGLAAITVVALGIRVAAAFWYDAHTALWGDAYWYSGVAKLIAAGRGFVNPAGRIAFHHDYATAAHPPLYPLFLSLVAHVDTSLLAQRLWSCVPGTGTVILLGLLTRDLAGERAGLIAAGLGAVFVELFAQDVLVMSEGLFGFTIVLTVLLSYRFLRQPNLLRAGLLAGAIALASLTRAEGALLFVILLVPLALRAKELELPRRLACIGVGALVAIVVFAPWVVYNWNRFDNPVLLSNGLGGLVGSSNCDSTYGGPEIGGWGFICAQGVVITVQDDESHQDREQLKAGLRYARDHANRLPLVIPARLLRSFGLFHPAQLTRDDLLLRTGRPRIAAWVAVLQYWGLLILGSFGTLFLYRRKVALLPFIAPVVTVAVITVVGYGTMRFRVALDALLPALAAVALDQGWRELSARRARAGTVAVDS